MALVLALTLVLGVLGTGCGATTQEKREVNVYNWGEYIDTDVLTQFEKETGIKVNYKTYPTNEALYSSLKSGGVSYDVIIPSDYMISRMIQEDMLDKIDFKNVPNADKVDEVYRNPEYDPTGEYSVPYMWGTVGIIYDTKVVTEPVTSWSILFNEKYSGKILMFDNSRDAIGIALKYLGYSYNTTDKDQIKEAVDLLVQQKPLVQAYVMDQIFEKLTGGEAAIGPYYAGDAVTMMEENPDLAFCLPSEGSNIFVDAMCIPKGAANKEEAEEFINFMCRGDISAANCQVTGYSTPIGEAYDLLPEDMRDNTVMYPDKETLAKCETYTNLPQDILDFYDEEWVRLMTD
ncbi:polyamine ABC transporter substrate-binding protein [Papillibacter cinnamivorans]